MLTSEEEDETMSDRHLKHWPKNQPRHLSIPQTDLFHNVEVSARRYPSKPYLVFYDTLIGFGRFKDEVERLAGFLQQDCGVSKGDRVLLYTQNSPQYVIGYYAILRANAVVVPVNPMNLTLELCHFVADSGARVAILTQDLFDRIRPLVVGAPGGASEPSVQGIPQVPTGPGEAGATLAHVIVGAYSDYLEAPTDLKVPDLVAEARRPIDSPNVTLWSAALQAARRPGPVTVGPDDLSVMPYTSGTTGQPKGCMHTHRTVQYQTLATGQWVDAKSDSVALAVLPLFHVTGMQSSMNIPLYNGNTVILLPRWDRRVAAQCIERYKVTSWTCIPTMVVDFLADPEIGRFDLSSISRIGGGGAAMPAAVAQKLLDMGLTYVEGYGLSETIAATHINPPAGARKQCLGIPIMDVDSRVVDPETLAELPPDEIGEIVTHGPQVFKGYWRNPQADRDCFVQIDGKRFFRTGDLARCDADGYFYMVDRLKRMINASGFKVWPAEVESLMYQHPAVQEACVIAARDARRGETVKAIVVLREDCRGKVTEQELVDWCHDNMAAYKAPRIVSFVEALPKSGTGKIMWRALQESEQEREQERGQGQGSSASARGRVRG
jgi:fatty-acyl-CoA synthase